MHGWITGGMKRDTMTQEKNDKKRRIGKKGGQQTDQCRIAGGGGREMQGRCVAGGGPREVSEGAVLNPPASRPGPDVSLFAAAAHCCHCNAPHLSRPVGTGAFLRKASLSPRLASPSCLYAAASGGFCWDPSGLSG